MRDKVTSNYKILFITPFFYPALSYGGPSTSVYNLAESLNKLGHQVTVFTTDAYSEQARYPGQVNGVVKLGGLSVVYFRNISNYLAYKFNAFIPLVFFPRLLFEINSFDVVHLHDFYTILNIWASLLCILFRKPYVIHPRGSLLPDRRRGRVFVKKAFIFIFGKMIINNASFVLALSLSEARQFIRFGVKRSKIEIIPNGIRLEKVVNGVKLRSRFRRRWSIDRESFVVLFVGRLHKVKGVDVLVKSFALLKRKMPLSKLVLVGPDAGLKTELESLVVNLGIKGDVIMTGLLGGNKLIEAYLASDILVLPSRIEPFGNVVLEAASYNLPLVVSSTVGLSDEVDKKVGLKAIGVKGIAGAIFRLYRDKELYARFRKQLPMFIKRFSWLDIAEDLVSIYERSITS